MTQKTAMQLFLDYLNYQHSLFLDRKSNFGMYVPMEFISKATELLAVEKETIYNAFVAGSESGTGETPFNCEQYYNQNYKQQP